MGQAATGKVFAKEAVAVAIRKIEEVKELVPTLAEGGRVSYRDLDELGLDSAELLEYMKKEGLVVEEVFGSALACPTCHGTNCVSLFKCSSCGSYAVVRERLIEHRPGGHIHPESVFKKDGGMVCPTCNRVLKSESEYRPLGAWFLCKKCGAKHAQLSPEFRCVNDGTMFSAITGDFKILYKYVLAEKAKAFVGFDESSIVELIAEVAHKKGSVERKFSVLGKSGVKHVFDLGIIAEDRKLWIDVAFSNDMVDDSAVLASFAKTFDVGAQDYLLVAWPKLTPSARILVDFYKIPYVEASDLDDLREKVGKHFD